MNQFKDFHTVEGLKFDISKLQKALLEVLKIKDYGAPSGITNFAAICLNQIPGKPESVEGHNARGVYWTKPDHTGTEKIRDKVLDETLYTEFVKDFEKTYFKEVYDKLSKKFKLGRVRILLKEPRSTLSWHRDPEPRLHIPIITNPGCMMVIENTAKHLPANGSVFITNNVIYLVYCIYE